MHKLPLQSSKARVHICCKWASDSSTSSMLQVHSVIVSLLWNPRATWNQALARCVQGLQAAEVGHGFLHSCKGKVSDHHEHGDDA